jgi:sarcosine oxidase, subunit beta
MTSSSESDQNVRSDVLVIGGGITGSSIALSLVERGVSVTLLERDRVGNAASGRNGGGVRQQNRHPAELALAMSAVKLWQMMEQRVGEDVGYRPTGNLRLIEKVAALKTFDAEVKRQVHSGLEVYLLSPEEVWERLPALSRRINLLGATYCPTDGIADPLKVTRAIARAAIRKGARIIEGQAVTGVTVNSGTVESVTTDRGTYRADLYVNAAGPWAQSICRLMGLDFPIEIKRSQIAVTEPLPPIVKEFVSADAGYMRQAESGGFHLGYRSELVEGFNTDVTLNALLNMAEGYTQLFPFLRDVRIIRSWAGITHWTPDHFPILDRSPQLNNLFLCAGFSGHGFCLGPAVGQAMAEWIVEGRPGVDLGNFQWKRFLG